MNAQMHFKTLHIDNDLYKHLDGISLFTDFV